MIYEDRIPVTGERKAKKTVGGFARPQDVDATILAAIPYEYPGRSITVDMSTDEFTCVCPFSGLPDFACLLISYVPRKKLIELKSLKLYLYAFRNVKIYNEHVVNKILEDLSGVLAPRAMTIVAEFTSRGGMKNKVTATYTRK
jgi:7-cyano-7-deazaguanine reductase